MRYTNPHWDRAALITIDVHCCTLDGGELEAHGTSTALPRMVELAETFATRAARSFTWFACTSPTAATSIPLVA
jgi:hypothetical protein